MVADIDRNGARLIPLVNNVGIWTYLEMGAMDEAFWERLMGVNLDGVFYVTNAVVPAMKDGGRGLDHQRRVDGRRPGRGLPLPLCRQQGRAGRPDQIPRRRARPARHPGQRRGPGLGGHRHVHGGLRRARVQGKGQAIHPSQEDPAPGRHRRADPLHGLRPGRPYHRRNPERQRRGRALRRMRACRRRRADFWESLPELAGVSVSWEHAFFGRSLGRRKNRLTRIFELVLIKEDIHG